MRSASRPCAAASLHPEPLSPKIVDQNPVQPPAEDVGDHSPKVSPTTAEHEVPKTVEPEQPSDVAMEVDLPSLPSLLYVIAGKGSPEVSEITFEVDETLAAATRRWAMRHTAYE